MGLAAFIRSHMDDIIQEWELFVRARIPGAEDMSPPVLRDHIRGLLEFIVNDLETPQSDRQRNQKAKGHGPKAGGKDDSVAEAHGESRFVEGFDVVQLHAEFRALRAAVLKLWTNEWTKTNRDWATPADVIPDLMRFNEAIDQVVSESLTGFVEKLKHSGGKAEAAGR